jgi:hypothetical protein
MFEKDLPNHIDKSYEKITSYLNEQGEKPNRALFIAYYNIDTETSRGNGPWDIELGNIIRIKLLLIHSVSRLCK